MKYQTIYLRILSWLITLAAPLHARELDFAREVRPILAKHCLACHGAEKQRGGLRLDRKSLALQGGDSGKAIVPGQPKASLLLQRASSTAPAEQMPPKGERLSAAELGTLTAWIQAGAPWPEDKASLARHWALEPVRRPTVPTVVSASSPIDAFIVQRLQQQGLTPSPEADRAVLIRRLKFGLLGLPPTPQEVEEFVADRSPMAYAQLVERYLASPHFGERWGRHWLDVVRYAESNGFETNQPRRNAWPYRDWVIQSFNHDRPYDQFIHEQLAGDSLGADAATGFLVAGAWDEVKSPDVVLTAQQRADELHDMVATTGATFLGLTVGCARCHAHKFDPIPQLDYYRLKAVFADVQHGERPMRGVDPTRQLQALRVRAELTALESKLRTAEPLADPGATIPRRPAVTAQHNSERFRPIRAKYVRFVVLETNQYEPCLDELEIFTSGDRPVNVALASAGARATSSGDYSASPSLHRLEFIHDGQYGNSRSWISNQVGRGRVEIELREAVEIDRIVWARDRQERFADRLATRYRIDVSLDRNTWTVVASSEDRFPFGTPQSGMIPPAESVEWLRLNQQVRELRRQLLTLEAPQLVYAGRFTAPEPTYRLHRGDPMQPREAVGPGALTEVGPSLSIPANATGPQRREALARWITAPTHPLTPRVMVNRLWHYHFGAGLVDTPSDFGLNGGTPSHPELLDWLGAELVDSGWSLKHIHRLIVTSATYRQSSKAHPEGLAKDAQTRLLWRYPPRRIEAEALRDAILFVSGQLDTRMGGPGFDLFQPNTNYVKVYTPKAEFGPAEFRRMVYEHKPRMVVDDTFGVFDCPDGGQIAPKRNVSTTPRQALNLLNSPFLLQQADLFAERVMREVGSVPAAQVERAFRLAFQRAPTSSERVAAESLVSEHGLPSLCRALLNANEFIYLD